jgi:hypothetical protein
MQNLKKKLYLNRLVNRKVWAQHAITRGCGGKIRRRNSAEPVIGRRRESEIARNRREEREYQPI